MIDLKLSRKSTPIAALARCSRQIAIAAVLLTLTLPMSAEARERTLRTLIVTGQGEETIPTTITRVTLGVEVQGKTATEVQREVADRSTTVVNLLRSRNVKRLQTTGLSLQPNYDYRNERRVLLGYTGTNTVSFRIAPDKAGALMDEAIQAGATRIDGIQFLAEDSAIAVARDEALREATQDAQAKADVVLNSLNLTRKEIVSIQIGDRNIHFPVYRQNTLVQSEAGSAPVIGGDRVVNASVTLEISY